MKYITLMSNYMAVFLLLIVLGCQKDLVEESELVGKWECIDIITTGPAPDLEGITFQFKADSTYLLNSKSGQKKQTGEWYTLNDRLYTQPEGGELMFVKIGRSGDELDTLRFHQLRGGFQETWVMARQ